MNKHKNYYNILGLDQSADTSTIREAYNALSQKFDPSNFHGSKKFASDMMLELNEAYDLLSDPSKRLQYDSSYSTQTKPKIDSAITDESPTAIPTDEVKHTNGVGAWRRFWARSLDFIVYQTLVAGVLLILSPAYPDKISWYVLYSFLSIVVWCFTEATTLTYFGTTIGKSILGISVTKKDSTPADFELFFSRSFDVLLKGWALSLPLINLVTSLFSKLRLEEKGETSWDEKYGFNVTLKPINGTRYALYILAFLIAASVHLASIKIMETKLNHGAVEALSVNKRLAEIRAQDTSTQGKATITFFGKEWYFGYIESLDDWDFKTGKKTATCNDNTCRYNNYFSANVMTDVDGNKIVDRLVIALENPSPNLGITKWAVNCATTETVMVEHCGGKSTRSIKECTDLRKEKRVPKERPYSEIWKYACNQQ